MNYLYVQYGCGLCAPEEWRNFDISPTLRLQKVPILQQLLKKAERFPTFPANVEYGDIIKGLPVANASCEAIYCSHILEHLSLEDLRTALYNTHRLLRQGGTFRFVLPDLAHLINQYINSDEPAAAIKFIKYTGLVKQKRERGFEGMLRYLWGNSGHRWLWDYKSLKSELEKAGFAKIRRAYFGDNPDKRFTSVEDRDRWEGFLGIECKK